MIDQFFWLVTNHHGDKFGNSLDKRLTFTMDLAQAIRAAVGSGFPIGFQFSQ